MLIVLSGTETNHRLNFNLGLGRFNRGLALIGFRTTGARAIKRKSLPQPISSYHLLGQHGQYLTLVDAVVFKSQVILDSQLKWSIQLRTHVLLNSRTKLTSCSFAMSVNPMISSKPNSTTPLLMVHLKTNNMSAMCLHLNPKDLNWVNASLLICNLGRPTEPV